MSFEPARGSELELRNEGSSGYRHCLDDRAVHAGSMLELLTDNGWVTGRYEWSFNPDGNPSYLVIDTDKDQAVSKEELQTGIRTFFGRGGRRGGGGGGFGRGGNRKDTRPDRPQRPELDT